MKRIFFRKPLIPRIKNSWYKEMVEGCKKYKEANCKNVNGGWNCSSCPFSVKPYCLLNILENEFGEEK